MGGGVRQVKLRAGTPDDLEAMFVLDQVCFEEPFRFDRRAVERSAFGRGAEVVIAELPERGIAGFAAFERGREHGVRVSYLNTLDVDPAARRLGLGGQLMAAWEASARRDGAAFCTLHVWNENEAAIRLYDACGFRKLAVEADFYGAGWDAVVFVKGLGG